MKRGFIPFAFAPILAACSSTDIQPPADIQSKTSLQQQNLIGGCPSFQIPTQVIQITRHIETFGPDSTGPLSELSMRSLLNNNYLKAALTVINMPTNMNILRQSSYQKLNEHGWLDVVIGKQGDASLAIILQMPPPANYMYVVKSYRCNLLIGTSPEKLVNNVENGRVKNIKFVKFGTIGEDKLLVHGTIKEDSIGILAGQSLSSATYNSTERAYLYNESKGMIAEYISPGLMFANAITDSSRLTAQKVQYNDPDGGDDLCSGDIRGTYDNSTLVPCTYSGDKQKTLTYVNQWDPTTGPCADLYYTYMQALNDQESKGYATIGAGAAGVGGVAVIVLTGGAAAAPIVATAGASAVTGVIGVPVAFNAWEASGYATKRAARAFEECRGKYGW